MTIFFTVDDGDKFWQITFRKNSVKKLIKNELFAVYGETINSGQKKPKLI